jgi:hypothetical protein
MGRMLIETVLNTDGVTLAGALEVPGAAALGQDPGCSWAARRASGFRRISKPCWAPPTA